MVMVREESHLLICHFMFYYNLLVSRQSCGIFVSVYKTFETAIVEPLTLYDVGPTILMKDDTFSTMVIFLFLMIVSELKVHLMSF